MTDVLVEPEVASDPLAPVLKIECLNVDFHTIDGWVRVVDDVSLVVPAGTTVRLVGESGSGKTVTSLAAIGLLPPDTTRVTGSIRLAGEELVGASSARLSRRRGRDVAMVFQEPRRSLDPVFTVGYQIAEVLRRHEGLDRRAARSRAVEMLDRVGIADAERRFGAYPHEFSGGMCQRVMLAIALACRPRLLIADEATTALDVTVQKEMLALMNDLQDELGVAILFITHDLSVVAETCDWVNVMYAGQVVESTAVDRLFHEPRHPYTEGLLAAIPDPQRRRLQAIPGVVPAPTSWPTGCRFSPRCDYAREGVCTSGAIPLEPAGGAQLTRCARHAEIELKGVLA
ncbi:ABC transporter ATP-binding protein [Aeromicrobium sp.]|uniref:ABC transporter ATP-binding protein n=1 Tax=Aeromicrobium sp. TaxID=1871063 RepID=UPI0025BA3C45|nr:ABC transporter ATP-binding protein [Aeromicrobium sp.]MCK5890271.1 ABC transporter ATP-binding protein [Aeromicrobium sp.]